MTRACVAALCWSTAPWACTHGARLGVIKPLVCTAIFDTVRRHHDPDTPRQTRASLTSGDARLHGQRGYERVFGDSDTTRVKPGAAVSNSDFYSGSSNLASSGSQCQLGCADGESLPLLPWWTQRIDLGVVPAMPRFETLHNTPTFPETSCMYSYVKNGPSMFFTKSWTRIYFGDAQTGVLMVDACLLACACIRSRLVRLYSQYTAFRYVVLSGRPLHT